MLHQIGAGTLGPVFRGHDTQRERLVAVKLFKLDLPPDDVHRLVAGLEHIVEANLSHPAIATPIAAGLAGMSAYLAWDYVAADSLDFAVREFGAVAPADALQVAARLASALDHAAAAGFTHGCLHPRDVLMSSHDTRLTGTGIGQALAEIGAAVPVRPPHTAPERVEGSTWDRRADVFSLAALVHEMLWGRRISGVGARAVHDMTEIAGGDLDALKRVFKRALAEDPGERHPTAKIFVDALKRALPDVAVETPASLASGASARSLRLASPNRIMKDELEPLLPLEPPRFTEVDVEPDPARTLTGPSIIEQAHDPVGPPSPEPLSLSEPLPPPAPHIQPPAPLLEPAAAEHRAANPPPLSWLSRDAEPSTPVEPPEPPKILEPAKAIEPAPVAEPAARPEPPRRMTRSASPRAKSTNTFLGDTKDEPVEPVVSAPPLVVPAAIVQPAAGDLNLLDRSRSAVWPLMLALALGVTLGFAGGYAVGVRAHPGSLAATGANAVPAAVPVREFTEGTVPDPPKAPSTEEVRQADTTKVENKAAAASVETKPATAPAVRTPDATVVSRTPDAAATSSKPTWTAGRLNVRSTPPGAKVFVDDRETGRTPMAVRNLAEGPHRVRIERDGYAAHDRRIVITRGRPVQLVNATLARRTPPAPRPARTAAVRSQAPPPVPPGRGGLMVDSRPPGARVYLDGTLLGITPLSQPSVPAGDHAIRLERDGYRNWIGAVRIVPSEQARVTASLER